MISIATSLNMVLTCTANPYLAVSRHLRSHNDPKSNVLYWPCKRRSDRDPLSMERPRFSSARISIHLYSSRFAAKEDDREDLHAPTSNLERTLTGQLHTATLAACVFVQTLMCNFVCFVGLLQRPARWSGGSHLSRKLRSFLCNGCEPTWCLSSFKRYL
jgi:hypothetical protein